MAPAQTFMLIPAPAPART